MPGSRANSLNADADLKVPEAKTTLTRFPGDAVRDRQVPPTPKERQHLNKQYSPKAERPPSKKSSTPPDHQGRKPRRPPLRHEEQIGHLQILQLEGWHALVRCHACGRLEEAKIQTLQWFKHSGRSSYVACRYCRSAYKSRRSNQKSRQRRSTPPVEVGDTVGALYVEHLERSWAWCHCTECGRDCWAYLPALSRAKGGIPNGTKRCASCSKRRRNRARVEHRG